MRISVSCCVWSALTAVLLVAAPMQSGQPGTTYRPPLSPLYAVREAVMMQTSVPDRLEAASHHGHAFAAAANATATPVAIEYNTEFPANARTAFQAAVDVWAVQITSPVPITIKANWVPLSSIYLSQGGATIWIRDDPNLPFANTWYVAALANKLAGTDLDPLSSDITINMNSSRTDWSFGTAGNPLASQFDFETVALHILTNGLGFTGTAASTGGSGSMGMSGAPAIYDRFVETASRQALLDTVFFANPSTALHDALTSDGFSTIPSAQTGLYWNGVNGIAAAPTGTRPRLDAQAPFTAGSNYVHLNEATYPRGDVNSLMTRNLSPGESVHLLGPITLGMLLDMGWSVPCNYTLSASSATVPLNGGTVVVGITTAAPCEWTASAPAGSFVSFPNGNSGRGNGTVGISVAPATAARSTTLTIAGLPFVVNQIVPDIFTDRATLRFGAVNNAGTLSHMTSPQSVAVEIPGVAGATWTARVATSSPWLTLTGGAGTGNGAFTISVQSHASLAGQTSATGTVDVETAGAKIKSVAVVLNLFPTGASAAPLGALDTPAEGSTNSGSVAVTGWALDDIEIARVQILRDAHRNDPPAAVLNGRVFVGDGSFVEGARPDVEAASATPNNYRGGWGYLMLTRGLIWDGQGPFKLYAIATDKEGNTTTLGSKTITINNAASTRPFGSIDTPGQGATVSGNYPNTGWVLTPNSGATIPASGVRVAIDGVFLTGTFSMSDRTDVTSAFPAFNTTGAGRGLFIDTTRFANGSHTIGWLVTDSAGHAEGIGSRFFKVLNGSVSTTATAALTYQPVSALAGIDNGAAVRVATGMDPTAPLKTLRPDASGRRRVWIDELDRVEVRLAPATGRFAAYHVANGQLRALPVGASFDASRGTLYWQPGAGYVGDYEFVVVDQARRDARRLTRLVVSVGRAPLLPPDRGAEDPGASTADSAKTRRSPI
jgi:hypothetical protein